MLDPASSGPASIDADDEPTDVAIKTTDDAIDSETTDDIIEPRPETHMKTFPTRNPK
jgi:hypothetical protein